jgi:iron complex outermembrane receptor protein
VEFINGRYQPSEGSDFGDTYTEEFQIAGDVPDRLEWLLGYYYRASHRDLSSGPYFSSFNNAFTNPLDANAPLGNHTADSKSAEKGLFGQATVDLSALLDGLHFTGGYRKTTSSSSSAVRQTVFVPANGGSYVAGAIISPPFGFREKADSYSLTADWQVNPDILVYVAHRKGFKPGGINGIARTANVPGLRLFFDPEIVKDYEFGTKARWTFGGVRGRSNLAIYYQDYTGLQRTEQLRDPNPPFQTFTQTNNIGAAEIKGLELENLMQVTETLTVTLNYAYIDAKYTTYPGTIRDIAGVLHNLIETPYTGTAKHQFTLDVRYRLPVPEAWGEVFASGQLFAQSGVWLDDSALNNPNFKEGFQPGYHNLNARLDWNNIAGHPVDASLFVKNIADDTRVVAIANFLNNLGINNAIYDEPRTFGVQVRARFGANAGGR